MVFQVKLLPHLCLCLLVCRSLHATDLAAVHVGDTADADIITPVALDVTDDAATAALHAARARQIPAVFRSYPAATNVMTRDFLAAFTLARSNFLSGLADEFHSATVDKTTIASADFGHLVTGFGVKYKKFPVPDQLAAEWARGGDGRAIREQLLAALQQSVARRVRPDVLPEGMLVGDTIRLVPVTEAGQKLSLDTVLQSPLAPAASLATLGNVQTQFRREFPAGQQLFARALAAFLQPNCLPDAPFTQLARGTAISQMIVAIHFDAGDTLVHRGDLIDAKIKAALTALKEKLNSGTPAPSVAVENPAPPATTPTPPPALAAVVPSQTLPPTTSSSKAGGRHESLIITLAGISAGALLVFWWQSGQRKPRALAAVPAGQMPLPAVASANPNVGPEVALAVLQELAQQRRELLRAQQSATEEIATLVRRLDDLQLPMQERLLTYETRIQTLEKELAVRTVVNRELLQVRIEMTRHQLATERAATATTSLTA